MNRTFRGALLSVVVLLLISVGVVLGFFMFKNAQWVVIHIPTVTMDWPSLLGRAASSSYVIHNLADRPAFERELRALFERFAADGRVAFSYLAHGYCWRPAEVTPGGMVGS